MSMPTSDFRQPDPSLPPRTRRVSSWWGYLLLRFFVCVACLMAALAKVLYEITGPSNLGIDQRVGVLYAFGQCQGRVL